MFKNLNFKSQAIVVVNVFSQGTPDKRGNMPVILTPWAGKVPNIGSVLSGTVAANNGFEVGGRYLVSFTETEPDAQYGRRFRIANFGVVSVVDAVQSLKALGEGQTVKLSNAEVEVTPDDMVEVIAGTEVNEDATF